MKIISTGMISPVGLNAESSCAAICAGISAFGELPYFDNDGEVIIGAVIPDLEIDFYHFADRLIKMLTYSVSECLGKVELPSNEKVPILIALPELDRPGFPKGFSESIIDKLELSLGFFFHREFSGIVSNGHTSGIQALYYAKKVLEKPDISICLVCGVDSFIRASSLLWLDQHFRLKTDINSDGVIPGEGSASILVSMNETFDSTSSMKIIGLGFAHEEAHLLSDKPLLGHGLSQALCDALIEADLSFQEIKFRLSDVTGESYGFREQMLMISRVMRVRQEDSVPLWHCAENMGEVGAAAGISQLIVASHAFEKGYVPGNYCASYNSSVNGDRSVAILSSCQG